MVQELLTVKEVARILKISRVHVYTLIERGLIHPINIGPPGVSKKTPRFRSEEIEKLIDSLEV